MSKGYKHAVSVSSQVYFCSAPIRIDAYDTCQFGCVYCFSRDRARRAASTGIHNANADALRARFDRIRRGEIKSALDEFLQQRVPIQLGGLQDPFTPREEEYGVTLKLLRVLQSENYPTLISTKGSIFLRPEYMEVLQQMNLVFRISAAGVAESVRHLVDRRTGSFEETLAKIRSLSQSGIKVALRIQPVFPSFEDDALRMASEAAAAGASQVTFEYLKLPGDEARKLLSNASGDLGVNVVDQMQAMGVRKTGPDWTLTPDAKRPFVKKARAHCRELGIKFGAGDTEFIPWSDGNGCCGSSSLFLEANQFDSNFVGAIKQAVAIEPENVAFSYFQDRWLPALSVGNYMDYRSRIAPGQREGTADWLPMLRQRWNGGRSPYSPGFFDGVMPSGRKDEQGMMIYDATGLARELA
jgi:DNA repair photolyase